MDGTCQWFFDSTEIWWGTLNHVHTTCSNCFFVRVTCTRLITDTSGCHLAYMRLHNTNRQLSGTCRNLPFFFVFALLKDIRYGKASFLSDDKKTDSALIVLLRFPKIQHIHIRHLSHKSCPILRHCEQANYDMGL